MASRAAKAEPWARLSLWENVLKTTLSTGRLVFAKESVYKGRMVKLKNSLLIHMATALQLRASDKIQGFSVFDKGFQVKSLNEARLYPQRISKTWFVKAMMRPIEHLYDARLRSNPEASANPAFEKRGGYPRLRIFKNTLPYEGGLTC